MTSREAGDLYEMKVNGVAGLSYDAGLPVIKALLEDRMEWIWNEDIDEVYAKAWSEWQHS
jgi:salicylate hydroxylase